MLCMVWPKQTHTEKQHWVDSVWCVYSIWIYNSKSNKGGYKSMDTDVGRGSERHREVDI